ncbi:hypothetical protein PUN28_005112 [Cardiocondyla obscurior]|uniref:Uncharacterized protein n=1 Tax=Cardiocondyla obscurior TaxID=286306 RepID=A0AAW2GJC6_9HYME
MSSKMTTLARIDHFFKFFNQRDCSGAIIIVQNIILIYQNSVRAFCGVAENAISSAHLPRSRRHPEIAREHAIGGREGAKRANRSALKHSSFIVLSFNCLISASCITASRGYFAPGSKVRTTMETRTCNCHLRAVPLSRAAKERFEI